MRFISSLLAKILSAEMLRLYPFARNHGISRHKAGREPGEVLG
jgi:hypothetical protein